jgi:hypothetical protein
LITAILRKNHEKWYNKLTMSSAATPIYSLPYPVPSDPVNVSGDLQSLAEQIENVLPSIGLPLHTLQVSNNSGESIFQGDPVYVSGFDSIENKPEVSRCDSTDINTFPVAGLAQTAIADGSSGVIVLSGVFSGVDTSAFTSSTILYTADGGGLTDVQPSSGSGAVGVVARVNVNGIILVGAVTGNGTWGSMKAGLS